MQILWNLVRRGPFSLFAVLCLLAYAPAAMAAPYAAMVVDARSGKVLHSRNADTRLHPASLTKMMTLYIAFEAVEHGEITLDTHVKITKTAAAEPPSKLGLRAGQKVKLRYLIRAAAVKSANDAATAIGIAIEGSEAAFARRMNRTAKALGMSRTTFKNAHGLTENGHLSTARDMTTLGRHLFYDYPEYYNLFSRITTDAGIKTVSSSNRRFLSSYRGADGIKTGYTRAAGFNLVASAERGGERIIATVFGGRSSATRNAEVARLLDLGFSRAPSRVAVNRPHPPAYQGKGASSGSYGKTVRVVTNLTKSLVPRPRPLQQPDPAPDATQLAMSNSIDNAVEAALAGPPAEKTEGTQLSAAKRPKGRPADVQTASLDGQDNAETYEIVTRISSSGSRLWGVNVGIYTTSFEAESVLLKTALIELEAFDEALRKVAKTGKGFNANFVGMTRDQADLACRRLQARDQSCATFGPS